MKRSIARWTTAMAAAAVIAVPIASYAQTAPPPSQPTPPAQTAPAPSAPQATQPAPDQDAAKQHLTAARNALSEMTQLPAAQQLTGEARTQVSQLIANFNELITTNAEWRASYTKLSANLSALLGAPASDEAPRPAGTAGAVGTSGTVTIDPAIKAKLTEFRSHLEKFEKAAGGAEPAASANPPAAAATAAPPQHAAGGHVSDAARTGEPDRAAADGPGADPESHRSDRGDHRCSAAANRHDRSRRRFVRKPDAHDLAGRPAAHAPDRTQEAAAEVNVNGNGIGDRQGAIGDGSESRLRYFRLVDLPIAHRPSPIAHFPASRVARSARCPA